MSPEQALGDDLDGRSDVYALGVVVYEMLTGRQPYEAKTPAAMMIKHVTVLTPLIDTELLKLPVGCNRVLANVLAKDREERYRTPNAFAEALMALAPSGRARKAFLPPRLPRYENPRSMDGQPTSRLQLLSSMLRLDPLADRKKVARWRALWGGALAGGLVLLILLGGGYWWWSSVGSVVGVENTLTPTPTATHTALPTLTLTTATFIVTPASTPTQPTPIQPTATQPSPTSPPPTFANTATLAPTNTTAPATRAPTRVVQPTAAPTQPPSDTAAPAPTETKLPPTNPPPNTDPPPTDIPRPTDTPTTMPPIIETPTPASPPAQ